MAEITRRRQRGMALVPVLILMVLLMSMGAALHSGIIADLGLRNAHQVSTQGFSAAEAGVNYGIATYRNIFLTGNVPTAPGYLAWLAGKPSTIARPTHKR